MLEFFRDPFALAFLIQTNFFAYLILCFVLRLLLFNFQGSSPPLSEQLCYYTTFVPFCQPLFPKFFQLFFEASFRSLCGSSSVSPRRPFYYTTFHPVCQYLFQSFSKFFSRSFLRSQLDKLSFQADSPSFLWLATALCDSFHIILLFGTFVKGFAG